MLREFFWQRSRAGVAWAWSGLGLLVAHGALRAWIKYKLNEFYGDFYDFGGAASEVGSGEGAALASGRRRMTRLLLYFAALCLPNLLLHPLYKLLTNRWVLSWRLSLMRSYIERWRQDRPGIENGAQRVHEDTSRFARGLHTCLGTLLDSGLTLAAFCPLLLSLGADVQPIAMPAFWLVGLCGGVAGLGVLGSVLLGWNLIDLEVRNQKVEADLRKKLVLLEESPASLDAALPSRSWDGFVREDEVVPEVRPPVSPLPQFQLVLARLKTNYRRLYSAFCVFSLWLQSYEQAVVLMPYFIAAPLLYSSDPGARLTLGKVTQLANAFSQVFSSLNVITDNWLEVTDWLSVLRRLREWERHLSTRPATSTATLIAANEARSGTELQGV
jgi:peptide/bleomycin uptake transporter